MIALECFLRQCPIPIIIAEGFVRDGGAGRKVAMTTGNAVDSKKKMLEKRDFFSIKYIKTSVQDALSYSWKYHTIQRKKIEQRLTGSSKMSFNIDFFYRAPRMQMDGCEQ